MRERILIIARPGRLRDALRALIATIPQLEIVDQVEDSAAALKMITEQHPTLILMDSSLPDNEVKAMLEQIKAERSQTYCIVLANTEQQEQLAIRCWRRRGAAQRVPNREPFCGHRKGDVSTRRRAQ